MEEEIAQNHAQSQRGKLECISFSSQVMSWNVTDNQQMPDQGVSLKGQTRAMQKACFRTQKRRFTK